MNQTHFYIGTTWIGACREDDPAAIEKRRRELAEQYGVDESWITAVPLEQVKYQG